MRVRGESRKRQMKEIVINGEGEGKSLSPRVEEEMKAKEARAPRRLRRAAGEERQQEGSATASPAGVVWEGDKSAEVWSK